MNVGAGLTSYGAAGLEQVVARVAEPAVASGLLTVLLAHRAGLVTRYWDSWAARRTVSLATPYS